MAQRRARGRPREFDPEVALEAALEAFRRHGYSGTSLADLTEATGLNRPSLYAAFGNKDDLFEAAVDRYWARVVAHCLPALRSHGALRRDLPRFFAAFLDQFADIDPGGCIVACGLPAEVDRWDSLREKLASIFGAADAAIAARLREAQRQGRAAEASRSQGAGPLDRQHDDGMESPLARRRHTQAARGRGHALGGAPGRRLAAQRRDSRHSQSALAPSASAAGSRGSSSTRPNTLW